MGDAPLVDFAMYADGSVLVDDTLLLHLLKRDRFSDFGSGFSELTNEVIA
jgi:hypothetical protein